MVIVVLHTGGNTCHSRFCWFVQGRQMLTGAHVSYSSNLTRDIVVQPRRWPWGSFCMLELLFQWDTFSHCGCNPEESVGQDFTGFLIMSQVNWENSSRIIFFHSPVLEVFLYLFKCGQQPSSCISCLLHFHLSHFYQSRTKSLIWHEMHTWAMDNYWPSLSLHIHASHDDYETSDIYAVMHYYG